MASAEKFNTFLYESGLFGKLADKQRVVFNVAKSGKSRLFTVNNVKDNLGCAYNTAATVLNGLVDLKLFQKEKQGSEWVYSMIEPKKILQSWA